MILHLLDDRSPQACPTTLALLADTIAGDTAHHRVLLLGGAKLEAMARSAGIHHAQRLGLPLGRPMLAPTSLARALARYRPLHMIHAWSDTALSAAAVFRGRVPRTLTLTQPPDAATTRRYLRLMLHAGFDIETPTLALRDELHQAGLPGGRLRHVPATLDFRRLSRDARTHRRARWRTPEHPPERPEGNNPGSAPAGTHVVALLSDPAWSATAGDAARIVTLVREASGQNVRLLVHPLQRHRPEVQDMLEGLNTPDLLIQDAALATPWAVLPAADAALLLGPAAPLATMWAMAADLPIVAPDLPHHRELLEPYPHACFAVSPQPKKLAHALQHLALQLPAPRAEPVVVSAHDPG